MRAGDAQHAAVGRGPVAVEEPPGPGVGLGRHHRAHRLGHLHQGRLLPPGHGLEQHPLEALGRSRRRPPQGEAEVAGQVAGQLGPAHQAGLGQGPAQVGQAGAPHHGAVQVEEGQACGRRPRHGLRREQGRHVDDGHAPSMRDRHCPQVTGAGQPGETWGNRALGGLRWPGSPGV